MLTQHLWHLYPQVISSTPPPLADFAKELPSVLEVRAMLGEDGTWHPFLCGWNAGSFHGAPLLHPLNVWNIWRNTEILNTSKYASFLLGYPIRATSTALFIISFNGSTNTTSFRHSNQWFIPWPWYMNCKTLRHTWGSSTVLWAQYWSKVDLHLVNWLPGFSSVILMTQNSAKFAYGPMIFKRENRLKWTSSPLNSVQTTIFMTSSFWSTNTLKSPYDR